MKIRKYTTTIHGMSPYSQSRFVDAKKPSTVEHEEWEDQTWRKRAHVKDGQAFIPGDAIKKALESAARSLSMSIPGKGKSTYTKRFRSGVDVDDVPLGVPEAEISGIALFVPSNGTPATSGAGGKRVMRRFPVFENWEGRLSVTVMDSTITKEVLIAHLEHAGIAVGVGRWRREVGGKNGQFTFDDLVLEPAGAVAHD